MSRKHKSRSSMLQSRERQALRLEELELRATPAIVADGVFFPSNGHDMSRDSTSVKSEFKVANTISLAGDYYMYQGAAQQLQRYVDRLTVSIQPTQSAATIAALTAPGGVLQYFEPAQTGSYSNERVFVAKAGSPAAGYSDFSYLQTRLNALKQAPGVEWAAPVFHYRTDSSNVQLFAGDEIHVSLRDGVNPVTYFGNVGYFDGYQRVLGSTNSYTVTVSPNWAGTGVLQLTQWMQADPNLNWASPNFRQKIQTMSVPNDTLFGQQWGLHNTGQLGGVSFIDADADLPEAWDTTVGSNTLVIGMSDTGIDLTHPDLTANLWVNAAEAGGTAGVDDDGNGYVDDVNGYDFAYNDGDPSYGGASIDAAHGTATAGIASAAGNNAQGISGTSQVAKLMAIRIFDDNVSTTDAVIEASLYYASGRHGSGVGTWQSADIQSASWGGGAPSAAIDAAFGYGDASGRVRGGIARGTLFAMAAGNGGAVQYPATLTTTNNSVMAIGAANELLDFMGASSGPELDVLGFWGSVTGITTTDIVGAAGYDAGDYNGFFGGTSAATPHVAGIASLVLSTAGNYNMTSATLKQLLRDSADKTSVYGYTAGFNALMGYGVANAKTAVDRALGNLAGRAEVQALFDDGIGNLFLMEDGLSGLDFGESVVGGSSIVANMRVYNWGSANLTLANPTAPTGFTVSAMSSASIAPGDFATFTISLNTAAAGSFAGNVVFTNGDNDTTGPENEQTYEIAVIGDVVVPSISGTIFEDWNGNTTYTSPTDELLAGEFAYLDANNNSVLDTILSNYTDNTIVNVPDPGTATATITVADGGVVADLNVALYMTHTWDSDMDVLLTSPSGTTVLLFSGVGGSGDDFGSAIQDMVMDDEGPTPVAAGVAPFTAGPYIPAQALAAFDGETVTGTWTLTMTDFVGADAGQLQHWSMSILRATEQLTSSDANGFYYFGNLPNGNYTVRHLLQPGWAYTTPSSYAVTISSPTDVNPNKNFGIAEQNAIYGNVFEDWDNDGTNDLTDGRLAGYSVYLDLNNNGVHNTGGTYNSGPVNVAIPDNNPAGASTSIVVSGSGLGVVNDINVTLNVTHTWDGDLAFTLSDGTTTVALITNRGGSGDNFTNTTLDDDAVNPIATGLAPFNGVFIPESSLTAFNGSSVDATWTLKAVDNAGLDVGTILNWSITFNDVLPEPIALSDAVGNYGFFGLGAGAYNVREILPAGWTRTTPVSGVHSFALAANATAFAKDFGNYQQLAVYGNVFNDLDASGGQNGAEGGLTNWTVWDDVNNNGTIDLAPSSFTSSPNLTIDGSTTHTNTQVVAGVGSIIDLDVTLNITHTWDADLRISLTRPGGGVGDTIALILDRGGSGDNFTATVLDDEAANAIGTGIAPFTGSFKPEQPLSNFDGFNADGTWTLTIIDTFPGADNGVLVDWTLTFTVGEANTLSGATNGNYALRNLAVGAHRIKEIVQPTWTRTVPVSGEYNVNITAGNSSFNNVFGNTQGPIDNIAPKVTGIFFAGSSWGTPFRTAAGNASFGFPGQTGANQLLSLPWNNLNEIVVTFSEPVAAPAGLLSGQVGVRGTNGGTYAITSVTAVSASTWRILLTTAPDTDWLIVDLDGDGGGGATRIEDLAGNDLAGTFTESVSTFPTAGAAGVDFKYRFKVVVGDQGRNGTVRNVDLNAVRNNLFIDIGAGGYDIFTDIDANGLLRNADLNAVRNHLFIDAPAVGPTRPNGGGARARGTVGAGGSNRQFTSTPSVIERTVEATRRIGATNRVADALDQLFAEI